MTAGEIDVVVFGATGVTGRQVAAYLAERAPEAEMRWAPAARGNMRIVPVISVAAIRRALRGPLNFPSPD